MSTLAGHPSDYDRELCAELTEEELARRNEHLAQLRQQANAQLLDQLGAMAEQARSLHEAGDFYGLRRLVLEIARLSQPSSASLLYGCCVALAEELACAGYRPWQPLHLSRPASLKFPLSPVTLLLEECSRLIQDRPNPALELTEYVERFWRDNIA